MAQILDAAPTIGSREPGFASMQGGGVGRIEDDRLPAGRGLDAREAVGDRIDPLIRRAYAGRGSPVGLG